MSGAPRLMADVMWLAVFIFGLDKWQALAGICFQKVILWSSLPQRVADVVRSQLRQEPGFLVGFAI
jgi:hypothetical protein